MSKPAAAGTGSRKPRSLCSTSTGTSRRPSMTSPNGPGWGAPRSSGTTGPREDVILPRSRPAARADPGPAAPPRATAPAMAAVSDAVRLVLLHYLDEGRPRPARRYQRLHPDQVAVLRDREIAQRCPPNSGCSASSCRLDGRLNGSRPRSGAELMAASVVAAHNHVLGGDGSGRVPRPDQRGQRGVAPRNPALRHAHLPRPAATAAARRTSCVQDRDRTSTSCSPCCEGLVEGRRPSKDRP